MAVGKLQHLSLETIKIFVNGEPKSVPASGSVAELLAFLELPADRIAVELNRTLVRKREWEATVVSDGARVEIVEFVGGG